MPKPHGVPDAETAPPIIIHTTQDAIDAAQQCAQTTHDEWLCCLAVDASDEMRAAWIVRGETCPFDVHVDAILQEVACWQPARLMTVRHHPHAGPDPLRESLPWVEDLYTHCAALQVPCNYVAVYADGVSFDLQAQATRLKQAVLAFVPLTSLLVGLGFL